MLALKKQFFVILKTQFAAQESRMVTAGAQQQLQRVVGMTQFPSEI